MNKGELEIKHMKFAIGVVARQMIKSCIRSRVAKSWIIIIRLRKHDVKTKHKSVATGISFYTKKRGYLITLEFEKRAIIHVPRKERKDAAPETHMVNSIRPYIPCKIINERFAAKRKRITYYMLQLKWNGRWKKYIQKEL